MPKKALVELIRLPSEPILWDRTKAATIKRSKRRVAIMSALATGWLPWGIEWHPSLTLAYDISGKTLEPVDPRFILCCGHVLRIKEAQAFVDAGLLTAGKSRHGDEALVITEPGRLWLQRNW